MPSSRSRGRGAPAMRITYAKEDFAMQKDSLTHRIGLAVREAQAEHDLSERMLAERSGVSRSTVHRLLGGQAVRPDLAVRIAGAAITVDLFAAPTASSLDRDLPQVLQVVAR